jgi:hypothetical protein
MGTKPGEASWRRRVAYSKAVWSWHPLLVSSRRRCFGPNRARKTFNPPMTVTRRIRRRGERGISCKTIVQGMPECSDCTCMLVCVFDAHLLHTRPRVQQAPGIPCALFFFGRMICKARAKCVAGMRRCAWNESLLGTSFETALSRLLRMRSETLMVRSAATPRVLGRCSASPIEPRGRGGWGGRFRVRRFAPPRNDGPTRPPLTLC